MSLEIERRAFEIARAAMELPEEERDLLLTERCDGDERLRALVDELLVGDTGDEDDSADRRAAGVARGMLGVVRDLRRDEIDHPAPIELGRYHIVREIGRGGMGVVYEAIQDNPRRSVALKVLHPWFTSAMSAKRLAREAELLGRLHHPGIAQVYDAGVIETPTGAQPYIALELIEGVDLATHANVLSRRAKLELVIQVCEAVGHAHERGIVHRDLKPGNVLVDAHGGPKVLDFGVARSLDADVQRTTMSTEAGSIVGTIAYMSPEQVAGELERIDARSDVYALGAVTFELLTGRLPNLVDGLPLMRAITAIRDEEAPRVGTLDRALRGDIETILEKALSKDRDRRYANARELAADLRRTLADEPIAARRPSTVYQLGKFARRNRAIVIGASLAFVALSIGLVVSLVKSIEASKEARKLRIVNEFLVQRLLRSPVPGQMGRDVRVVDLFDQARKEIDISFRDEPELRALLDHTLGVSYASLDQAPPAVELLSEAVDVRTRLFGADSALTLDSKLELARALNSSDRNDEGLRAYEDVEAGYVRTQGDRSEGALAARIGRAELLWTTGRLDEGLALARATSHTADEALGPLHVQSRHALLTLIYGLSRLSDQSEAVALAVELVKRETTFGSADSVDTLNARFVLARLHNDQGRNDLALPELKELVAAYERIFGVDSLRANEARVTWSVALDDGGRVEEALELQRKATDIYAARFGAEHPITLLSRNNQAISLRKLGRLPEAEELATAVLESRRRVLAPGDATIAASLNTRGAIRVLRRDLDGADADLTAALAIVRAAPSAERRTLPTIRYNLAELLRKKGEFARAEALFRELLADDARDGNPDNANVLSDRLRIAQCAAEQGRFAEAEVEARALLAIHVRNSGEGSVATSLCRALLGRSLLAEKRAAESEPELRAAIAGLEGAKRKDLIDEEKLWSRLADALDATGRAAEANEARAKIVEIR